MAKEDIIRKLTSRKLWIAVAALVSGLILAFGGKESTAQTVSGVILQAAAVVGYLLSEGLADAAGAAAGTGAAEYNRAESEYRGQHEAALEPVDATRKADEWAEVAAMIDAEKVNETVGKI